MNCKLCNSPSSFVFHKKMTRNDFKSLYEIWYKCSSCGLVFTRALDKFSDEQMNTLYGYPEYFRYDPPATISRRDGRVEALIKRVQERFGIEHPKILFHGNGASNAIFKFLLRGYDVYATYSFFNWDGSISVEEAQEMGDFDIVCGIEIVEHWTKPEEEMDIVDSCLKKGCVFCGTTSLAVDTDVMAGDWHALRRHSINAGHVTMWSEKAFDVVCDKYGYENHTERGDSEMRAQSHMPSSCIFFQFKK